MKDIIDIFDSILCLCGEGVEFLTRTELAEAVIKETYKGLKICKAQQQDSTDEFPLIKCHIICQAFDLLGKYACEKCKIHR